jgi:3-oxoacyl-[acyl-carrier-protein] synthase-3
MSSTTTPRQTSGTAVSSRDAGEQLRHDAAHAQSAQSQANLSGEYRHVVSRLTGVQILGSGSYAPPRVITNEELAPLGYDKDWIVQRTGICERRRAADEFACSDLAAEAAKRCLDQAGVSASELDLIVVATFTGDSPIPSTACQLQRRIGGRAAAFDLGAACSGFMYALVTGMQFVKTGSARRVLVVGSEVMSRFINPADTKTFPLFGDGAGAVLLGAGSEQQGLLAYTLGADGSGADLLRIPGGGTREPLTPERLAAGRQFIQMEGRTVFKWAVNLLADSVRQVLAEASVSIDDLSLLILHQANRRIVDSAAEHLGIPPEKVVINLDRYGNTSAASIPLALDEVHRAGRLKRGDLVLLSGFGSGLAWGTAVLRW